MDIFSHITPSLGSFVRLGALLCAIPVIRRISYLLQTICTERFSRHMGVLIQHGVLYGVFIFIAVNLLHECGFNVSSLLGAAGVIGVALVFASQTSMANIISGFFLLLEQPFMIGDTIKIDNTIGVAESIDLLAVKVRTFDNKLIRIPNEVMLKQSLTNATYYSVKRIELLLSVPYTADTDATRTRIIEVIKNNKLFLTKPGPYVALAKVGILEPTHELRMFFAIKVSVHKENFTHGAEILFLSLKKEFDGDESRITLIQMN